MASKTDGVYSWSSTLFCLVFMLIKKVEAHYCDNDRCSEEEYCCGDNMCCPSYKVWDWWYFWCGVLFFMFLLSLCTCLWRYRFLSRSAIIISGYNYTPLQEVNALGPCVDISSSSRQHHHGIDKSFTAPLGTPPPYNQVSAGAVKAFAPPPSYAQVVGLKNVH